MSTDETKSNATVSDTTTDAVTTAIIDQDRSEKIIKAKELYSHGSRNFLVKSYSEAADELSEVCSLYEELYGELSDELGMPYLLYAKSLIALALDENKVIDVPDAEELDDDDDDDAEEEDEEAEAASSSCTNGNTTKLPSIKEDKEKSDEADSTADNGKVVEKTESTETISTAEKTQNKTSQEALVSSSIDEMNTQKMEKENGSDAKSTIVVDGEKPSTSNGDADVATEVEEENDVASSLQLAWEILELAAKIFSRQGLSGLPNLAEVQTELANIQFENNILDASREDYEKALKIYNELPTNYRRAKAEIFYKIGLTYLMQQLNKEGAESLKEACKLIEDEIQEIKEKPELTAKDTDNIQDLEETKQEIWAKIAEIEETQSQNIAEVRAALDSYIKPISSASSEGAGPSSSNSTSISSSSIKPNDISHLIKRKRPDEPSSEAEAVASPAKRPAA